MYTLANVQQVSAVDLNNPAVGQERARLERRALDALRKWTVMSPIERAFSFEMEQAARDLLAFERRHQADGRLNS